MKVSSKYIIDIWEFMENYYGIIYDDNYKLVHDEMCYYLRNKNIFVKRIGFKDAKNDKILSGDVVLVRDEEGKVAPYVSPKRIEDLDLDDKVLINTNITIKKNKKDKFIIIEKNKVKNEKAIYMIRGIIVKILSV